MDSLQLVQNNNYMAKSILRMGGLSPLLYYIQINHKIS